ncbi:acetyl-CoA synthetase-like protein [Trametopsis cervina]|nr:acetyl-CoA synthetase-like protein [Trametopsis cervina]
MAEVNPSYLTCTASQAQEFNALNPHGICSLNELLESRARTHPAICVAGFPERCLDKPSWERVEFTFASLFAASNATALHYSATSSLFNRPQECKEDRIVALLSPSGADFLVTLFAALRLGYGILLLAPQNTDEAIIHLCRATSASHLICHSSLLRQGRNAIQDLSGAEVVEMAPRSVWQKILQHQTQIKVTLSPAEERDLTAVVMHTSGSTGLPKPIHHPHRIWTEAIPCMPGNPAFTTTPLFHGGSADLFRSMNALTSLYMFPSTYPITIANILGAVAACPESSAFLSVPYILKLLAEDSEGLEMLQRMELVSVGGAPLPEQLGDQMVRSGVKLVSRLGSSECGFLMSSHRNYQTDLEWGWLRNHGLGIQMLHFEAIDDSSDTFELRVSAEWTTRVVSNRPDGSFATGDLYIKHPTKANTWKYSGRADDVIVMTNGKKASANFIETKLRASRYITEAIAFGASKPMLGVLVIPSSSMIDRDQIAECVHELNQASAPYATIFDEMIVVLPYDTDLPKTSKGSVIRPQALKKYADIIENTYRRFEEGTSVLPEGPTSDEDMQDLVRRLVSEIMKPTLRGPVVPNFRNDDDLFNLGLTSLQALSIRGSLQKLLDFSAGQVLGDNVVFDYPTVQKLTKYFVDVRRGSQKEFNSDEQQLQLMKELLLQYESFPPASPLTSADDNLHSNELVVLTGATGGLGAHIFAQLLSRTSLHIIALIRADNDEEAERRLQTNLEMRKLQHAGDKTRYTALAATLSEGDLGLSRIVYERLLRRTRFVIHAGWPVNFAYNLESFKDALQGMRALLELTIATQLHARVVFCSSVAAASNNVSTTMKVPEALPKSERSAAPMGYARSKWIAEHICNKAYLNPELAGRLRIARLGQLCGDTQHGIWNEKEAWPLLIASVHYTGCLPVLRESMSWLPLDVAAAAVLDIALNESLEPAPTSEVPVYHVIHPTAISWTTLLEYLDSAGLVFERVAPEVWLDELARTTERLDPGTRNLIQLWERKVCSLLP